MTFQKKIRAGAVDPDSPSITAAEDAGAPLSAPASLAAPASPSAPPSLSKPPATKKAFGGGRNLSAGGGGGSKFGGFRKGGGGVTSFAGGQAVMAGLFAKPIAPKTPVDADLGGPPTGVAATATKPMYSKKPLRPQTTGRGERGRDVDARLAAVGGVDRSDSTRPTAQRGPATTRQAHDRGRDAERELDWLLARRHRGVRRGRRVLMRAARALARFEARWSFATDILKIGGA